MPTNELMGKRILITGGARRIGRHLALSIARAGGDIILHHANSPQEAALVAAEIESIGRDCTIIQADFNKVEEIYAIFQKIIESVPLYGLVNNAAIFEPLFFTETNLGEWQRHININLTTPFLLSQLFFKHLKTGEKGRIVNILDWRALRPGQDHFPYTISKAALAAMTQSLAVAMAPQINVNALALGAILPPGDDGNHNHILDHVPAGRWGSLDEVAEAVLFLLSGNEYITGQIIHLDGGRHLI